MLAIFIFKYIYIYIDKHGVVFLLPMKEEFGEPNLSGAGAFG